MKLHTVVSTLAVVAAMTLSGSALAQSMVGTVEIPADRLADFEAKCAAIASAQTESLSTPVEDEAADATETGSVTDPANAASSDDADPASEDNLDALLASMTPEQCKEAGLVKGPVPATTQ